MGVVSYNKELLKKLIGIDEEQIIEYLNKMGFPSEIIDNEIEIETTPDRPDMFFAEGIARALRLYLGKEEPKEYSIKEVAYSLNINDVEQRPYIAVCAIRNVKNKTLLYESLIKAQEKLHETFGRKRKKIAIGVHDLSKIIFPLTYKEVDEESFIPLDKDKKMTIEEILEKHEKGIAYKHLVQKPYPMLYDNKGVISFPPIINSERTKINEETDSFLIDVTGIDENAVNYILDLFATSLAYRGGEIVGIKSNKDIFPKLTKRKIKFEESDLERRGGIKLDVDKIKELLKKFDATFTDGFVEYPPYRVDILDESDAIEDILISIGYDNIEPLKDQFFFIGSKDILIKELEELFIGMGFREVMSFFLGDKKRWKDLLEVNAKEIINPLTEEFNALRPSLALNLLDIEAKNKTKEYPHKIFEIGHVFYNKELLQLGFLISDKNVIIEDGIAVIKRFFKEQGIDVVFKDLKIIENNLFVWKACYEAGNYYGCVGIIHPKILEKLNLEMPVLIGIINMKEIGYKVN